jgi:hypothetical protein
MGEIEKKGPTECRWCKGPAFDPNFYFRKWNLNIPLCPECAILIKQGLNIGQVLAKFGRQKLAEKNIMVGVPRGTNIKGID